LPMKDGGPSAFGDNWTWNDCEEVAQYRYSCRSKVRLLPSRYFNSSEQVSALTATAEASNAAQAAALSRIPQIACLIFTVS